MYPSLDGLRGLAILMVVLGHFWSLAAGSLTDRPNVVLYTMDITSIFQLAGYGVYLFFVMSAFLLYLPYARATISGDQFPSPAKFYFRRFLRIYPAYAAMVALYLTIAVTLGNVTHLEKPTLSDVLANLFLIHPFAVFWPGSTVSPNLLHGTWSLAAEVYFYAVLPGVAIFVRRTSVLAMVSLLSIGTAIYYRSVLYPMIDAMDATWQQKSVLWLNPISYMDSFTIGILSARAFVNAKDFPLKYRHIGALVAGGASLCGILAICSHPLSILPLEIFAGVGLDGPFMFNVLCGVLIPSILLCPTVFEVLFASPYLRFVGIVSYSLFLTHISFARILAFPVMEALNVTSFSAKLAFLTVVFVPISILFAFIFYMVFERPWLTQKTVVDCARDCARIAVDYARRLPPRVLIIYAFAWYGATVAFNAGLPEAGAIPDEILFRAANLTDANWVGGVSRTGNTILISADSVFAIALKDKTAIILEDGTQATIKSFDKVDGNWMHLTLSNVQPDVMSYPRRLIAVR